MIETRVLPMVRGALLALVSGGALFAASPFDAVLVKMDQNAATFKSMSAKIKRVQHTAVINEDDNSEGAMRMRRTKREAQLAIDFTVPDTQSVAVASGKAEKYMPKLNQVEEYDLGKARFEKYMALGFGASSQELKADYAIKDLGEETVKGDKTVRMELTPKDPKVAQNFPKIELWVSEEKGYPVQEKFHQTGGDYQLVTFSDVAINPTLPDSAFKLNLPKGVKRIFPGK